MHDDSRVCAILESDSPLSPGEPLRAVPLATATRWDGRSVYVPSHVVQLRPAESLYVLLDAPAIAGTHELHRLRPGQLQGPLSELSLRREAGGVCVRIELRSAPAPALEAPAARPLEIGTRTRIVGFPAGGPVQILDGEILAIPEGNDPPSFRGLRRGSQRLVGGMSGSPVFAGTGRGWELAGMVVGALETSLSGRLPAGSSELRGARIFPFFLP